MKTVDINNQDDYYTDDERVNGLIINPSHLVWGNLYGDIDKQKDLKEKFDTIEKEINALSPEGFIADVVVNGKSVVDKHIANIDIPIEDINRKISNLSNEQSLIKDELRTIDPKIDQVEKDVEENILPRLKTKIAAFWYDNSAVVNEKKYWYALSDASVASLDPDVTLYPSYEEVKDFLICKKDEDGNDIPIPFNFGAGGGGGGGGDDTIVRISQINWPQSIALGTECMLTVEWSSFKDDERTGAGTLQLFINDILVETKSGVSQGQYTFNVTKYILEGTSKVAVYAIDSYDNKARTIGNITTVDIRLTSNFDYSNILSDVVKYTYTPIGLIEKTVHFIVDGVDVAQDVVLTSNEQQTHRFTNWSHGSHTLKVYFTCMINGTIVKSNELYYDLIYAKPGVKTPIIASDFVDLEQEQFNSFVIPYRVYTPGKRNSNISLIVDGDIKQTLSVDQSIKYWENKFDDAGLKQLIIRCESVDKVFNIDVKESEIDVKPVTQDLSLALNTIGRSNSEEHPEIWEDKDRGISCKLTNFNFTSDGWVQDRENNTVLRITGDARVEIPFKIFASDFKISGKTIELEFATSDVRDYETTILSCMSGNRGIKLTPQLGIIKSQQSELQTQYKEDEHVRLSFVVEKQVDNRIIYMYIDGVMCGAIQYPTSDSFRQLTPVNIFLGSNDATLDIYNIRVYDNNLDRKQVVNNWIADTQSGTLKRSRYIRNNNYNESGDIVIDKLPDDTPYIIWDVDPLPQFKGDKKPGNVEYVDPSNHDKDFKSENATYNVQGTSSAVYPVKNIRIKYKQNKDWPDKLFTWVDNEGNIIKKFSITDGGIGDNYFTYKVDYASSEGANNVELVRLYNDICRANGILTPPQKQNNKVRVGIDGFPIVSFKRNADGIVKFNSKANFNNDKANEDVYGFSGEWNDPDLKDKWIGDESWETTQNSAEEAVFKKPITQETFANAYEIRFPDEDGYSDISKLKPLTEWIYSTYRENATDEQFEVPVTFTYTDTVRSEDGTYSKITKTKTFESDTAEYRLTKFKAEFEQHFNLNSSLFYYLFTHLFLMVDSRAKNAFPTYFASREEGDGGDRWYWIPYDMDTALGINNEGKLVFDYSLEDTDKVNGANVFNGQDSVMWCNLRDTFDGEIGQLYASLRTSGSLLSYDTVEKYFDDHQSKWSENIFNEDSYIKYVKVLAETGSNYLEMLQGSKAQQRKWWLYNRFKYFDSKYLAGDSKSDFIQFRAYVEKGVVKPNLYITPYADIYATASYANSANAVVSKRAKRGETVVLENPFSIEAEETDQETYIYSSSQLKSIGDISLFKPDTVDISHATRLQELKVGDKSPDYENEHLTSLALGANTLLRTLDVRNCTGLHQAVDVSGCSNIEEIYFDGTNITGVTLPNGGVLKTLHLPETVTTLEIRNQLNLVDLEIPSTDNVQTLWIENIPMNLIDPVEFVKHMPNGGAVRLVGISVDVDDKSEIEDFYNHLDMMTGLDSRGQYEDKAQVNGTINIDTISYKDWFELSSRYEDVVINAKHIMCSTKFYNEDQLYYTTIVEKGDDVILPENPSKEPTVQYEFVFTGWDKDLVQVQSDLETHATYEMVLRSYEVKFDTQTSRVSVPSQIVHYGDRLVKPQDPEIPGTEFKGWFRESECINPFDFNSIISGPLTLYGKWEDVTAPIVVDLVRESFNKILFKITDNIAVTKYAITNSEEVPTEWIDITPVEEFTQEYEITGPGVYYIWGSDAAGHVSSKSIQAYSLSTESSEGVDIKIFEDSTMLQSFALQGTEANVVANLDSHYENLEIRVNGSLIESEYSFTVESDVSIAAKCAPKSYVVKFNLQGKGTPIEDQIIVYNNLVAKPSNQFYEGYIVDGWFKDRECIDQWHFSIDTVSNDIELFARWVEYVEPTIITVNADSIRLNFFQSESDGVAVKWGDESEDESSSSNKVTMTHTYNEDGPHDIQILCKRGTYLLGDNNSNQCIMPSSAVTSIKFAYNIPYTNPYAFKDATNLESIELTDYMTEVATGAFLGCTGVTELIIPDNIIRINDEAFQGCTSISGEIVLPSTLKEIGRQAFYRCASVTNFELPASLVKVGDSAFYGCTSLLSVIFENVESIGSSALAGCSSLVELILPESLVNVGASAFAACSNLAKVVINGIDTKFDGSAFNICPKLKTAGPKGGDFNIEFVYDKVLPDNIFSYGYTQSSLVEVTLPDTLEEIGDNAFINANISSINLPQGLKKIGSRAFERTQIHELDIPSSVNYIGSRAFAYMFLNEIFIRTVYSNFKADMFIDSFFYYMYIISVVIHVNKNLDTVGCKTAYGLAWNNRTETANLDSNLVFDLD